MLNYWANVHDIPTHFLFLSSPSLLPLPWSSFLDCPCQLYISHLMDLVLPFTSIMLLSLHFPFLLLLPHSYYHCLNKYREVLKGKLHESINLPKRAKVQKRQIDPTKAPTTQSIDLEKGEDDLTSPKSYLRGKSSQRTHENKDSNNVDRPNELN